MTRIRQRGVALITAVGIAALVAAMATFMMWRYSLWFRQVENQHDLAQARSVARAAIDFTRLILREDANQSAGADHALRPWNTPIPNYPVDSGSAGGQLHDAQGRFNFNNMIDQNGNRSASELLVFKGLLKSQELPVELADNLCDFIDPSGNTRPDRPPADQAYLGLETPYRAAGSPLADTAELTQVKGFTPEIVAKLEPFVVAGPIEPQPNTNVNFASAEVLAAIIDAYSSKGAGSGAEIAAKVVARRNTKPFLTQDDLWQVMAGGGESVNHNRLGITSTLFFSDVEAHFGRITVAYEALLRRIPGAVPSVVYIRRR